MILVVDLGINNRKEVCVFCPSRQFHLLRKMFGVSRLCPSDMRANMKIH